MVNSTDTVMFFGEPSMDKNSNKNIKNTEKELNRKESQ